MGIPWGIEALEALKKHLEAAESFRRAIELSTSGDDESICVSYKLALLHYCKDHVANKILMSTNEFSHL